MIMEAVPDKRSGPGPRHRADPSAFTQVETAGVERSPRAFRRPWPVVHHWV